MTDLEEAADAVASLDSTIAIEAADAMADAFEQAGARIARSLEEAAGSGALSFERLAESVLSDLAKLALGELLEGPLTRLADGIQSSRAGSAQSAPTVNLNLSGVTDPSVFRRSEGQIAAALARAVSTGRQRI